MVITVAGEELDALREILEESRTLAVHYGDYGLVSKIDLFEEAFE